MTEHATFVPLTAAEVDAAHALVGDDTARLLTELAARRHIPEDHARALLAHYLGLQHWRQTDFHSHEARFDLLPLAKATRRNALVFLRQGGRYGGVLSDPFDTELVALLTACCPGPMDLVVAADGDLRQFLILSERNQRSVTTVAQSSTAETSISRIAEELSLARIDEQSSTSVKLLSSTLYDALKEGASDIHLAATPSGLVVKYRLDGVLDDVTSFQGRDVAEQVISRVKVLAELDISERRVPQDGSFAVRVADREIDLRVSVMPSLHGEDAVLRVLDKQALVSAHGQLTLEALGMPPEATEVLRSLVTLPHGMLLVTGPTGSGKTTTLYAALSEINSGRDKIITIEDPVEYQLPGILQIPVNEKKGLTFARGLRSILRHDPDKIMVGEIRDRETAEIAVQSALTGHLVLTTVHANNVFEVFGRFAHMGVDPYAFVSALNGIWAQRLIRLNCSDCSAPHEPSEAEWARVGLGQEARRDVVLPGSGRLMRGQGCVHCRGTGYRGRRAVAEFMTLTDELREMIVEKQPIRRIKAAARASGTRSLREAALELALRGATTLEEVNRVTLQA
jgi:general secretion pathway protein E